MMKFNTPKIGLDLGVTNKNTPEYIKKIKNKNHLNYIIYQCQTTKRKWTKKS